MILILLFILNIFALDIQRPHIYKNDINVTGWMMSEKLDGIRAYWDGKQLLTKNANPIHAPEWFTKNLPPFKLDGELWSKRGDFEFIQSTVLDSVPSSDWEQITYHIFEVPDQDGTFEQRLQKVSQRLDRYHIPHLQVIPQLTCLSTAHLESFLQEVERLGGEGVVIKDPTLPYHTGRSVHVLKVKSFQDMEGEVIAVNGGRGKYKEMMGSLTLKLHNGITFKLGSGFSDALRKFPPKVGDVVTFKHYGFTKYHKPKFASFMRLRKSE